VINLYVLNSKGVVEKEATKQNLKRLAAGRTPFWLDIRNLSHDKLSDILSIFKVHKLVIEDCVTKTRTKLERFPKHNFVVVHGVKHHGHGIQLLEIDIVQGRNWLISYHDYPIESFEQLKHDKDRLYHNMKQGSDFLLHTLIDMEVDNYFPTLELIEDNLEEIEDKVIHSPKPTQLSSLFELKRALLRIRKEIMPQRQVIMALSRRDVPLIRPSAEVYFRDVYDHLIRVTDILDSYRETVSNILETHFSVTSNKMNEVMKVLTVIATIMIRSNKTINPT